MLKKEGSRQTAAKRYTWISKCRLAAVLLFSVGMISQPLIASAQLTQSVSRVDQVSTAAGLGQAASLPTIVGRIINVVLATVGILLLGYLLYAGFLWMTASGDPKKVDKAKDIIRQAVIGLLIVVSSFAIARFIIGWLSGISGGFGGSTGTSSVGYGFPSSAGSLGGGIIETHYPQRDATDVPRNTMISVSFKEPMKLSTIIAGYGDNGTPADLTDDTTSTAINADDIKIYKTSEGRTTALGSADVRVGFTADRKTFVFRPVQYLGSPTVKTDYTVELTPGIHREDNSPAFTGSFSSGYRWQFEVSTVVDNTPPRITSVIPYDGGSFAPNVVVQVNFSEPVDPTSASGIYSSDAARGRFTNLEVASQPRSGGGTTPSLVTGQYTVSNQYSTVEFLSDASCGVNSCGRQVFCLPSSATIQVTAKAASLSDNPPSAVLTSNGFDGIVDMAGNSLDGNSNATADGPATDNKVWRFGTEAQPNLAAPKVLDTEPPATNPPSSAAQGLPIDHQPKARFDSMLQASTVTTDQVQLRQNEPANDPRLVDTFWWTVRQLALGDGAGGSIVPAEGTILPHYGQIAIKHRNYLPPQSTTSTSYEYDPYILSGVQNIYQNCFNPASSNVCSGPSCCNNRGQASCNFPRP